MKNIKKNGIVGIILWSTSMGVNAEVPRWELVQDESTVVFTATQNGAPISGKFNSFKGEIAFDPLQLNQSKVRIIVDTGSVTLSYQELADTLKTEDWFNVKKFPEAQFTSENFNPVDQETYEVNGKLTIRDKTMPMAVKFMVKEQDENKMIIDGGSTFSRSTFGVGQGDWASTEEIKDAVKVDFHFTLKKIP